MNFDSPWGTWEQRSASPPFSGKCPRDKTLADILLWRRLFAHAVCITGKRGRTNSETNTFLGKSLIKFRAL
ncbi:unnamed protein product [Ixodes persulcatus]